MESDDVDKIDGGGEISWRRTFWSSAEEAFNNTSTDTAGKEV